MLSARLMRSAAIDAVAVVDGSARIATRVRLGVANQTLSVRMPVVEVGPASYHKERGVELRLPFVHKRF